MYHKHTEEEARHTTATSRYSTNFKTEADTLETAALEQSEENTQTLSSSQMPSQYLMLSRT